MPEDKIDKVSNALVAAWRDGGSVNISEDLWPMSLKESMAIQDAFDAKKKRRNCCLENCSD